MICKECGEEADALLPVTVQGKRRKVCEECVDRLVEEGEIADAALEAMRGMMDFKGRF